MYIEDSVKLQLHTIFICIRQNKLQIDNHKERSYPAKDAELDEVILD